MITTAQHYDATKARLARFEDALAHAEERARERLPLLQTVLRGNIESALHEIYRDLAEYDERRGIDSRSWLLGEDVDPPLAFIRARILAGLTQADLARKLTVPEAAVREYEATRYANVGFDQLRAIAATLGLRLSAVPATLRK